MTAKTQYAGSGELSILARDERNSATPSGRRRRAAFRRRERRPRRPAGDPRPVAMAGPNELPVTRTVQDLVAGSGIEFADRGTQALNGVPGRRQILAVRGWKRGEATPC